MLVLPHRALTIVPDADAAILQSKILHDAQHLVVVALAAPQRKVVRGGPRRPVLEHLRIGLVGCGQARGRRRPPHGSAWNLPPRRPLLRRNVLLGVRPVLRRAVLPERHDGRHGVPRPRPPMLRARRFEGRVFAATDVVHRGEGPTRGRPGVGGGRSLPGFGRGIRMSDEPLGLPLLLRFPLLLLLLFGLFLRIPALSRRSLREVRARQGRGNCRGRIDVIGYLVYPALGRAVVIVVVVVVVVRRGAGGGRGYIVVVVGFVVVVGVYDFTIDDPRSTGCVFFSVVIVPLSMFAARGETGRSGTGTRARSMFGGCVRALLFQPRQTIGR
mmetsp:Transcript_22424/g.48622  ORF Transcript_22424/g.48622 Transcript_22424/m.48622 type:complete len:328 (-) Transcript_22424:310-1293(-)